MPFDPAWNLINPLLTPVVKGAFNWVKNRLSSNRQRMVEISELSSKVEQLSYGNQMLVQSHQDLLLVVLALLRNDRLIAISDNTISIAEPIPYALGAEADGGDPPRELSVQWNPAGQAPEAVKRSIFDGVDEAISAARLSRPSERKE